MQASENTGTNEESPLDAGLKAEIEFWSFMINDCGAEISGESMERMQQALALAEARLIRSKPYAQRWTQ